MKVVTASSGKKTVKMNKADWIAIGHKANWFTKLAYDPENPEIGDWGEPPAASLFDNPVAVDRAKAAIAELDENDIGRMLNEIGIQTVDVPSEEESAAAVGGDIYDEVTPDTAEEVLEPSDTLTPPPIPEEVKRQFRDSK